MIFQTLISLCIMPSPSPFLLVTVVAAQALYIVFIFRSLAPPCSRQPLAVKSLALVNALLTALYLALLALVLVLHFALLVLHSLELPSPVNHQQSH